jgi:dnaD domain protein
MARPVKEGLDYYPLNADFMSDIKVRRLIRSFGSKSIGVVIALLGMIYGDKGYYILLNDDVAFIISEQTLEDEDLVNQIINKLIEIEFFDKNLYEKHRVLTSKGIQKRFISATERRKDVKLITKYNLVNVDNNSSSDVVNVYNNPVNVDNNPSSDVVNVCNNQQRKEKKSKVKKSKEKESKEKQSKENTDDSCNAPSAERRVRTFAFESLVVEKYGEDECLTDTFRDFAIMRKAIKKPLTERATKVLLGKLDKLANGDKELVIKILEQSILNNWQSVYELKDGVNYGNSRYSKPNATTAVQTKDKWDEYDFGDSGL